LAPNLLLLSVGERAMTTSTFLRTTILATGLLFAACATSGPRTETVATHRLPDSAPERSAALRSATPGLDLEADDERWGIEAAKERKRDRPKTVASKPAAPAAGAGSIDVKAPSP
jgi:hypothetical protein